SSAMGCSWTSSRLSSTRAGSATPITIRSCLTSDDRRGPDPRWGGETGACLDPNWTIAAPTGSTPLLQGTIEMADTRPRRRWLEFSLRTMLLAVLALSVWLGWWVNRARNQAATVAAVKTAPFSANVVYDDDPNYFPQDAPVGRRF